MSARDEYAVSTFEAKTHLSRLLQEVEKGRTITITRRGKPIARLVPIDGLPQLKADALVEKFRAIRESVGGKIDVVALVRQMRDSR
jgi:prevent-host-death family protein